MELAHPESFFSGFETLKEPTVVTDSKLLVPSWINQEVAMTETIEPEKEDPIPVPMHGADDLAILLIHGPDDVLEPAKALIGRILEAELSWLDSAGGEFCANLFVAASLYTLHSRNLSTWGDVLDMLEDPCWLNHRQTVISFTNDGRPARTTEAGRWIVIISNQMLAMPETRFEQRFLRSLSVIREAITGLENKANLKPTTRHPSREKGIQIFSRESVAKAYVRIDELDEKRQDKAERHVNAMRRNKGIRQTPNVRKAMKNLEQVTLNFKNLEEPVRYLQSELALAASMPPNEFRIAPILLLGDPGIGKTYLALQLAEALGVPMSKLSAGSSKPGFDLTGSHPSWAQSMPGSLITLLSTGHSATPVMVIDEVDKMGIYSQYPLEPTLLDILEPNTARTFKDQFFDMEFDASHVIYLLTANDLKHVSMPLQSRVAVFDIPRPGPEQRLSIIQGELARLRVKTRKQIDLDGSASDLAERVEIDLRQTLRLVREAFTQAMIAQLKTAKVMMPVGGNRRSFGFVNN